MAILLHGGATFLHIPKTGGSWVTKTLYENNLVKTSFSHKHADMERVLNFSRHYCGNYIRQSIKLQTNLQKEIENSFKFCFVRNPFQWYESYWRYACGVNWKCFTLNKESKQALPRRNWHPNYILHECKNDDFNVFMENILQRYPGYVTSMFSLYTPPQEIDFIGKTESLIDDLIYVLKKLDIKFDDNKIRNIPKINESYSTIEKPTWKGDIKEKIYYLEYPTLFRYGYLTNK
jgi:hypothetical protein